MPPQGYQPYPYPYPYPYANVPFAPTPPRQWPVPAGRRVPLIWTVTLVIVTVVAVGLALIAPSVNVAPPQPGPVLYASNLAQDDGAWNLRTDAQGQCAYANGGLDAATNQFNASDIAPSTNGLATLAAYDIFPTCLLKNQSPSDLYLSVRIVPQANIAATLQPAIIVHSSTAFLFTPQGQLVIAFQPVPHQWQTFYEAPTNEWRTAAQSSNTIVLQIHGTIYTIALNGVQVYQGDFQGNTAYLSPTGSIALGAYTTSTQMDGEAAYANFTLATPA